MAHTLTNLLYQFVFSTKHRRPEIDDALKPDLLAYLGGIVRGIGGEPLCVNGVTDHVPMLVVLPQTVSVADAMRTIKANSSGWVHDKWPDRRSFRWQAGYGAFTVSRSRRESVRRYVARQEEHHRKVTFEDEFLKLLAKHDVTYDPRFVVD